MIYEKLMRYVLERRPERVCLEAGHIYLKEKPTNQHMSSIWIGQEVGRRLAEMGIKHRKMLFVDDYHIEEGEKRLDLDVYLSMMKKGGFEPDEIVMESNMRDGALSIVEKLNGSTVLKDGIVCLKKPKVHLVKPVEQPTCSLLDAALYLHKLNASDFCITVLHETWLQQQSNTRHILRALGKGEPPVANVFFNGGGSAPQIKLPK